MEYEHKRQFIIEYDSHTVNQLREQFKRHKAAAMKKEYYSSYDEIVKNMATVCRGLDLHDPISISMLFEIMLWNGYFSVNKKYQYNPKGLINNPGILGGDIMKGTGVCLNNAAMLSDVLNETSYEAYVCGCSLPKIENITKPDIKRDYVLPTLLDKIRTSLNANKVNHALTLVNYTDDWFLCDPTNFYFFELNHFLAASLPDSHQKMAIDPELLLRTSSISKDRFYDVCFNSYINNNLDLDSKSVLEQYKDIIKLVKDKKDMLKDFYDGSYDDILNVARTLKR